MLERLYHQLHESRSRALSNTEMTVLEKIAYETRVHGGYVIPKPRPNSSLESNLRALIDLGYVSQVGKLLKTTKKANSILTFEHSESEAENESQSFCIVQQDY